MHPRPFHMQGRGEGEVTEIARAKVNLFLGVGDARADGYHELVTVFQSLSLADEITLIPGDGELVRGLTVSGPSSHIIPCDSSNLAWAAAEVFASHAAARGITVPSVAIHITKGIPVAGGMAGGSADAAAVLRALNHMCGRPFTLDELVDFGAELGSDVPFCVMEGQALAGGRGEKLTPLPPHEDLHFALAFHRRGLSTPKVFAALDDMRAQSQLPPASSFPRAEFLAARTAQQLAALIANDLQAPAVALAPYLAETLAAGRAAGALASFVSGSGPTCAFLCTDETSARKVARAIADAHVADDTAIAHAVGAAHV